MRIWGIRDVEYKIEAKNKYRIEREKQAAETLDSRGFCHSIRSGQSKHSSVKQCHIVSDTQEVCFLCCCTVLGKNHSDDPESIGCDHHGRFMPLTFNFNFQRKHGIVFQQNCMQCVHNNNKMGFSWYITSIATTCIATPQDTSEFYFHSGISRLFMENISVHLPNSSILLCYYAQELTTPCIIYNRDLEDTSESLTIHQFRKLSAFSKIQQRYCICIF